MKKNVSVMMAGLAAALVLTGLSGCSAPAEAQENGSPTETERTGRDRQIPVRVQTLETTTFVEYGEYVGEARGVEEVRLTAGAGGRVAAIHASEGDVVAAGQSLGEIDPEKAMTRYETAVLNERLAEESYRREQRFLQEGNSFQLKVDQAHLAWLNARSALLDAESVRESAFAESPIDGTVVRRHISPNDNLESGDPTFDVADLSRMTISVGVPEADIAGVQNLGEAEIHFPAFPDRTFTGEATRFARTRSERTLTYNVEVEMANESGIVLSGQTARVRLPLRRYPDVITVPSSAVYIRNNTNYVMVARNDIVREIPVRTGPADDSYTVILDGLSSGDRVVTEGFNRLADGAPIRVID
jgi:RND family efflux transporter MFP subunit